MSNCCDRFVMIEGEEDSFETWQGLRGPYYTPSVSEDGTLSWTNNGDLQNPAAVNLKGPPGAQGPAGDHGPGVAEGGTTGQLLAKSSDEDFDTEWIDPPEMDAGHVSYDSTETYSDGTVGKELGTLNSALTSLSAVTEIIDTASGAIASFPDGAGLPMRSLVAQINPVQDLHGQDAPYPAGGGKNLCALNDFTKTKRDVTFAYANGKLIVNGTPSSAGWFGVGESFKLPAGSYTVSYKVSGSNSVIKIGFDNFGGYIQFNTAGTLSRTFTLNEEKNGTLDLYCDQTTAYANTEILIQIEAGSTATAWSPYKNICPISGWTGVEGQRTGKNLLPLTLYSGGAYNADVGRVFTFSLSPKQFTKSGDSIYTVATTSAWESYTMLVPIKNVGQRVRFSGKLSSADQVGYTAYLLDKDYTVLTKWNGNSNPYDFDIYFLLSNYPDARFISLTISNRGTASETLTLTNPQLEVTSSTASPYEPYTGEEISVSWQTEAGTVYGGTVDVVTGVLTADRPQLDMGDLTWVKSGAFRGFVATGGLPSDFPSVQTNDVIDALSPYYKAVSYYELSTTTVCAMSARSGGNIGLAIQDPTLDSYYDNFDANVFKTAVTGRTVFYKSTQPQTYQLEPQQISTLIGNNTVFVDCGSIEVTYQASIKGYIDKVLGS